MDHFAFWGVVVYAFLRVGWYKLAILVALVTIAAPLSIAYGRECTRKKIMKEIQQEK